MASAKVFPLGDRAVIVELAEHYSIQALREIQHFSQALQLANFEWIEEWTTAYTTVTIYYDLLQVNKSKHKSENVISFIKGEIAKVVKQINGLENISKLHIEIPICYDDEFSIDLDEVAKHSGLKKEEVISLHSSSIYEVAMIGFSPGFPFLLGLPKEIATPRKKSPRLKVEVGSVGIAGVQTGIYPSESPGGWQIIGRTPINLFRPHQKDPSFLKAGDKVRFTKITKKQFYELENK
jgi:inhibitor of KinA